MSMLTNQQTLKKIIGKTSERLLIVSGAVFLQCFPSYNAMGQCCPCRRTPRERETDRCARTQITKQSPNVGGYMGVGNN